MSSLQTVFKAEIELLTPLHIGTGKELLLNYDIVPRQTAKGVYTFRVNEDAVLERAWVRAETAGAAAMNQVLMGRPASELLTAEDFANLHSPLFRYAIPGQPSATTPGSRVREQIKDAYDRPYIPGSSLKGALRTLLLRSIYQREKKPFDPRQLGRNPKYAGQPLETAVFGQDPNHDVLRALHVEDSQPLPWDTCMAVRTAYVYPAGQRGGPGAPIEIEVVRRRARFQTMLRLDEYGFRGEALAKLGWQGQRERLVNIAAWAKPLGEAHMQVELEFHRKRGPDETVSRYEALLKQARELPANAFVLHLGWGTGWESKTLASAVLRQDKAVFEQMLQQYRMTKDRVRRVDDAFPKSRRLLLLSNAVAEPLGWVKVTLTEE